MRKSYAARTTAERMVPEPLTVLVSSPSPGFGWRIGGASKEGERERQTATFCPRHLTTGPVAGNEDYSRYE
jgi:hypothetical protein